MPRLWYHGKDFHRWIADKISAQRKESGAKFPLLTKKKLIHVKKKNKLQWSVTKYIKHTPEQAIYLEIFGQHKRLSMFVCVCFFPLLWFGIYSYFFSLLLFFRERSCCWLGMDIKIVWKDLEVWKEYDLINRLHFLLKLVHVDFLSLNNIYLIVYNNFVIYLLI